MALTSAAIMLDFTWFREQTCLVACPYGRFQSVLLDKKSLIIAYDYNRGEPRTKGRARQTGAGDCIDCGACVLTCPTGIDIRDGLQMECIHCTQCADACDEIMRKVERPQGLIRYTSRAALEAKGQRIRKLRPRTVLYPTALAITFGGFLFTLATRNAADVTVLRGLGAPYSIDGDGRVANQLRVKVTNRTRGDTRYTIAVDGIEGGSLIAPRNPLPVAAGETEVSDLFVVLPTSAFDDGERHVVVRVRDDAGSTQNFPYELVGPDREHSRREHSRKDSRP
jgi:cytochrome c oxidase accessory protein FixG